MMPIGIGIVGCGRMGNRHAIALQNVKDFKLVGCFDEDEGRSFKLARTYHVQTYNSLEELLGEERIQCVIISTPNVSHKNDVLDSMNFEKHILVEKPLATNSSECDEIIQHQKKKPHLKIMVGHTHRFYPHNLKVKELIDKGKIGEVKFILEKSTDPGFIKGNGKPPEWVFKNSKIGPLIDIVHIVDKIRWITNSEIEFIHTSLIAKSDSSKVKNMLSTLFILKNKTIAQIFFLSPSWGIRDQSTSIIGTKGEIKSIYGERVILGTKEWKEFDFYGKSSPPSFEHNLRGFQNELQAFADSIKKKRQPPVTVYDGRKAVEITSAIIESYKNKRVISIID